MLESLNVPIHKIASFEITDIPLIKYIASKDKPILISTGIAREEDIQKAVNTCKSVGNNHIILLKCVSVYPTPYSEANLKIIQDLKERFGTISGLSDHSHGIVIPIVSVVFGANVIEKHFILDRELKYPNGQYSNDREFSLEPKEFTDMVKNVRRAEKVIGKVSYELSDKQKSSREFSRSLYVAENVKEGDLWTKRNVRSVRPGFGMHPEHLPKILGKKVTRNAKKGERMSKELYE